MIATVRSSERKRQRCMRFIISPAPDGFALAGYESRLQYPTGIHQ